MTREEMIARRNELMAKQGQASDRDAMMARRAELMAKLGKADAAEQGGKVLNEQYEPLQGSDRALIKNLGGDREAVMNYLQKKHPQSEFKFEGSGVMDVLGRDRGAQDWKRMDQNFELTSPSTWELQDVSDIGGDIAEGVAETAGGIAGLSLGGVGAVGIPAAIGAGAETLRQSIGKGIGLRNEMDAGDIAMSGALSGAFGAFGGVGAGAKAVTNVAEKQMKKGLQGAWKKYGDDFAKQTLDFAESGIDNPYTKKTFGDFTEDELARSIKKYTGINKGLAGRALGAAGDKAVDLIGSVSGVGDGVKNAIKHYSKADKMTQDGADAMANNFGQTLLKASQGIKESAGATYEQIKKMKGVHTLPETAKTIREAVESIDIPNPKAEAPAKQFVRDYFSGITGDNGLSKVGNQGLVTTYQDLGGKTFNNILALVPDGFMANRELIARTIHRGVKTIRDQVGDKLENTAGKDLFKKANSEWAKGSELLRGLEKITDKDGNLLVERFVGILKDKETNAVTKREIIGKLKKVAETLGVGKQSENIMDILNAYYTMSKNKASFLPTGSGYSIARAAGGLAAGGALAGAGMGEGGSAPMIGAGLGLLAGSPMMIRKGIGAMKGIKSGLNKVTPKAYTNIPAKYKAGAKRMLWNEMNRD